MTAQFPTAESRITGEPEAGPQADAQAELQPEVQAEPVAEEILVEEISIDGMCGVY